MDNFYQIIFPARMTSDHHAPLHTVNAILPAVPADIFSNASTQDTNAWRKVLVKSVLLPKHNDIYTSSYLQNQKKEVNDTKMNLKHCKTVQCNMYLTQA
jgi:hypothetical protein